MQPVKSIVIAAAGVGRRIGRGIPKCLIPVNGKCIFEYQLELVKDIPEVRFVVGFEDMRVIEAVTKIRKDVIFVRNSQFQSTSSLQSFSLGATGIKGKVLLMDGDMIISKKSFDSLLDTCAHANGEDVVAIADDLSCDPVYAHVTDNLVHSFSTSEPSLYEWANIAYVDGNNVPYENTHLYQHLEKNLPKISHIIRRLEIDTQDDFEYAEKNLETYFE